MKLGQVQGIYLGLSIQVKNISGSNKEDLSDRGESEELNLTLTTSV